MKKIIGYSLIALPFVIAIIAMILAYGLFFVIVSLVMFALLGDMIYSLD